MYSGISGGTETLAFRGEIQPELSLDDTIGTLGGTFSFPFRYGYSCVARVEQSAGGVAEGTTIFAYHPHQSVLVVPATDVLVVDGIEARLATLLPLVETALQIALDCGSVLGQTIVVSGLGAVGVLTGALLRRAGATVIGIEPRAWRREVAAAFGVDAISPDDAFEVVNERSDGRGVSLFVEVSGAPKALTAALPMLSHEGTVLVASWYGTKPVQLPLGAEFHRRRLTIRSTQVSTIPASLSATWTPARRRAVALSVLRELPVKLLATHEFDLHDAQAAFLAVDQPESGLMHAALRYGSTR
jgi:2-desacetyl-2-hydroxyethyl bacteriochlorophyllide A dehydrogenase